MSLKLETEEIQQYYEKVRTTDEIRWVSFGYKSDDTVGVMKYGENYDDFIKTCEDSVRQYAFASFNTGDEMSKRKKFAFIVWIGENVKPKLKAAVSTHRAEVKKIVTNFAVEVQASSPDEVKQNVILAALRKAGGANYGNSSS